MPPRSQSASGYRGVRACPNGSFLAEICSGDDRVNLGSYATAVEAGRARSQMNFPAVCDAQETHARAPTPRLVTAEDRRHRAMQGLVAETDEHVVAEWYESHPQAARSGS